MQFSSKSVTALYWVLCNSKWKKKNYFLVLSVSWRKSDWIKRVPSPVDCNYFTSSDKVLCAYCWQWNQQSQWPGQQWRVKPRWHRPGKPRRHRQLDVLWSRSRQWCVLHQNRNRKPLQLPQNQSTSSHVILLTMYFRLVIFNASLARQWPRWVWVGECFFWYRLTWVVLDKILRAVKWLCVCVCVWPGDVVVSELGLQLSRSRLPAIPVSDNDVQQVVNTHVLLSPSSII